MNKLQRTSLFVTLVITLALSVFPVSAQINPIVAQDCGFLGMSCTGSENYNNIRAFMMMVIQVVLTFIGIIAAIFIVYAGFRYITSRGDEEAARTAKNQILYAILGILVAMTAFLIVNVALFVPGADITLINTIRGIVNGFLIFTSIVATIYIIIAGAMYVTSQGDQEKASRAKMQLLYALLGLVVILISGVLINFLIGIV